MLQCPSGDEEFSTKSVANMQLKQREGVLHLAYHVVFPLIIQQRPLRQRVWAEGTALGQNWRPDACDVPPFCFPEEPLWGAPGGLSEAPQGPWGWGLPWTWTQGGTRHRDGYTNTHRD